MLLIISIIIAVVIRDAESATMSLRTLPTGALGSSCLDGSPYAYYYRLGSEKDKWIIHHEGGGWCYTIEDCYERSKTNLGSSKAYPKTVNSPGGLLSDDPTQNPDFYTWNVVYLKYCDGSSFSGYTVDPVVYKGTSLHFRGHDNLIAAAVDIFTGLNMQSATDVIITGCSAGGLATYLHLDWWRDFIPAKVTVKGISDAGWFLDTLSVSGKSVYTPEMRGGFQLWNSTVGVNQDCIKEHTPTQDTWKCIMAQYTYPHIKTPIFVYNSKYDSWQMPNILRLTCHPNQPNGCNQAQMAMFDKYGSIFLTTIEAVETSPKDALHIDACFTHCQSMAPAWTKTKVQTKDGTKISANDAFYNWYYGKNETKAVDVCTYPCNSSC